MSCRTVGARSSPTAGWPTPCEPFDEQDQLVYVEVQSGFILMGGEDSGVDFAATQSWLLLIDPEEPSSETSAAG